jgi:hypothetical protein
MEEKDKGFDFISSPKHYYTMMKQADNAGIL